MYQKVRLTVGTQFFEAKGAIVVAPQSHLSHTVCIRGSDCRPVLAPQHVANAGCENDRCALRVHAAAAFSTLDARNAPSYGGHEPAVGSVIPAGDIPLLHQDPIVPAAVSGGLGYDLDVMLVELEHVFTALRRLESSLATPAASKSSTFH